MEKKSALFKLRKKAGLSQRQLAELCNTSSVQICNLENGNRTINENWLNRLSKALNCTKAELLGEEPVDQLTDAEKQILDLFRSIPTDKQKDISLILSALSASKKES